MTGRKLASLSAIVGALLFCVLRIQATVFLTEPFNYTTADLGNATANGTWDTTANSAITISSGSNLNGPAGFPSATGGKVVVGNTHLQKNFSTFATSGTITSGTVYECFLLNVTSTGSMPSADSTSTPNDIATLSLQNAATPFCSIRLINSAGCKIGIAKNGGTGSYRSTALTLSTVTNIVVMKYDFSTSPNTVKLYVLTTYSSTEPGSADATISTGTDLAAGTPGLGRCYLSCAGGGTMGIDELRIASTWAEAVGASSCTTPTSETVSGTTEICSNSPATVTLHPSQSGVTYQLFAGASASGGTQAGTGSDLTWSVTPAATTTYTVQSTTAGGFCATSMTGSAVVTVDKPSAGGTASPSSSPICTGSSPTVTLSGQTGSVSKWQYSADNFASDVHDIANATTTLNNAPAISATTSYRAVVTNGVCSSTNSTTATVTVSPLSVGGTATPGASHVCTGSGTTVALSGNVGSIQWQQSTDGINGWANVSGGSGATTTTYTTPNLTTTTFYRAQVTSGLCSAAFSTTNSVTVDAASVGGTTTPGAAHVCTGNGTTVGVSGNVGTAIQWQQSANGTTGWANVAGGSGATTTTYTTPNLTTTTFYRAQVTSGVCSSAFSTTNSVTVDPAAVGGSIAGGTTVCSGNGATLTLSGQTGSVTKWQYSTNNFSTDINDIANTTTSLSTGNLAVTTYYRAVVTSGVCAATANSSTATVTVNQPAAISAPSASAGCSQVTLTWPAVGGAASYNIYRSTTSGSYGAATYTGLSGTNYNDTLVTAGTPYFYKMTTVSGASCESALSSETSATPNAPPTITLGTSPTVCTGTTSASLPYTATTGTPDRYSIVFDSTAHTAGFADVALTNLPASPIALIVPGAAAAATYNGTLTVNKSSTSCSSAGTAFTVTLSTGGVTINGSPSSTTQAAGNTATFSVNASGIGLSYLWQTNGVTDSSAASSSSYTTRVLTLADSGMQVQCVITPACGSPAIAGPATLTVVTSTATVIHNVPVLTFHNDNARMGENTNEFILTPGNVNTNTFIRLFTNFVDGVVYAQPLVMTNVTIPGKGVHNVLFVVTEHDSVYAFDADNNLGANASPLWKTSFLGSGVTTLSTTDQNCTEITPEVGITSTPVIDPVTGTIYVVAKTKEVTNSVTSYVHRLHALDITTGSEKFGGPVAITGSVSGNGAGNVGGVVTFNPLIHLNRQGLLLQGGVIYIGFASLCDNTPYHGWLFGYDAATLAQTVVFNANPNGSDAGFWEAGCGPTADGAGNIYISTGNGTYDGPTNSDYGDSLLKFVTTNGLVMADYFTPSNQAALSSGDKDFGSGGVTVLPDETGSAAHSNLVVTADKLGTIYLIDRNNLTQYNTNGDQVVQELKTNINKSWGTPAYFNRTLYYIGTTDKLKAFGVSNATIITPPLISTNTYGARGGTPAVSANGSSNGVVWSIESAAFSSNGPAILYAYNATNVALGLYSSTVAGQSPGGAIKFIAPAIANGKVYVGTVSSVAIYGLKSPIITNQPQALTVSAGSNAALSVSVTSLATAGYQWRKDGANLAGATNTLLTITNVQGANVGLYSAVVTDAIGTAISVDVGLTLSNRPPVAGTDTYTRTANNSLQITITDLLTNDSDPDLDTLSVTGINTPTTNGVTLTTNSLSITYPGTPNVNDAFTYTIGDGRGGSATGTVLIHVTSNTVARLQDWIPGLATNTITLGGDPNRQYVFQFTTNFNVGPWLTISTNTADANGILHLIDNQATNPSRIYRLILP